MNHPAGRSTIQLMIGAVCSCLIASVGIAAMTGPDSAGVKWAGAVASALGLIGLGLCVAAAFQAVARGRKRGGGA